jgi:hypothetical protein
LSEAFHPQFRQSDRPPRRSGEASRAAPHFGQVGELDGDGGELDADTATAQPDGSRSTRKPHAGQRPTIQFGGG